MGSRISQKDFENRVYSLVGNEYTVVGEYISNKKKVDIRHNTCGVIKGYTPTNFYNGNRCNVCRIKKQTKTHQWFLDEVYKRRGNEYIVVGEYTKAKEPILMRHKKCGYEWCVTPDNFLRRYSECPRCKGNARITTKEFLSEMYKILGDEYSIHGEYKTARTKMKFTHNICGNSWMIAPYSIKSGVRCPFCKSSKGETIIQNYLKDNNIAYEKEKTFTDCKYKGLLKFDFYIPHINICIEYDGIQHFEPVDFANKGFEWSLQHFNETIKRDDIKTNYCKSKNIPLLRIPYYLSKEEIISSLNTFISNNKEVKQRTLNQS